MASNYGLGQMTVQNLELSDIADVTVTNSIKRNSNNNKIFAYQYKHPSKTFDLVPTDVPAHEHPHEHDPNSLASLDDVDETVAEMKNSDTATPFGFILNPLTKDFKVHPIINRNLVEVLQEEVIANESIRADAPYVIYYNKINKKFTLQLLYTYINQSNLYNKYAIHLKISPIETIVKSNNIVKKIINSGNLYLSYQADDGCRLQYDTVIGKVGIFAENSKISLSAVNQNMYQNVKKTKYGTMIIECIVNNTEGSRVRIIDDIKFWANKREHGYFIINIQTSGRVGVKFIGAVGSLVPVTRENNTVSPLDIEHIFIKNILLIDVKLIYYSLNESEINSLTSLQPTHLLS